jgi:hypothetical protein
LIDIGSDPDMKSAAESGRVVLRVHLRRGADKQAIGLPDEIDGIPVRVIAADYRPEKTD